MIKYMFIYVYIVLVADLLVAICYLAKSTNEL